MNSLNPLAAQIMILKGRITELEEGNKALQGTNHIQDELLNEFRDQFEAMKQRAEKAEKELELRPIILRSVTNA